MMDEPAGKIGGVPVHVDPAVGDMILLMSPSQFEIYKQAPEKFISWLRKTGKLPEPPPKVQERAKEVIKRVGRRKK